MRIKEDRKENGMGLRDLIRSSGIKIFSLIIIRLGLSLGLALDKAFQFFPEPVYHFEMMKSVSPCQRTLCI